jgi:ParB family transcriptional regulator, chromosome partitioning protein
VTAAIAVPTKKAKLMATAIVSPLAQLGEGEFKRLPLKALFESPTNPRTHYDDAALDELAQNIKANGVIQPIVVRAAAAGKFEIVVGHRRFRASSRAGMESIPAIIHALTDAQVRALQLIENAQREDVHPFDEAVAYSALRDNEGFTVDQIVAAVGKSKSEIYQRLQLLKLTPKAREAFVRRQLETAHAVELARLQPKDQDEALRLCLDKHHPLSFRGLKEWIQRNVHLNLRSAPFKMDDATLLPKAGACLTCQKRTGAQPALFPDVKQKDTCTDRPCFQAKIVAFVDRKKAEHEANGETLLQLDTAPNYYGRKPVPGVLLRGDWRDVSKQDRCEHTQRAIVVAGDDVGQTRDVCTKRDCKNHWKDMARRSISPKERAAKAAELRERRAESEAMVATIRTVVSKVKSPGIDELRLFAMSFVAEYWHQHLEALFKRRGWEPKKGPHGIRDFDSAAIERIKAMSQRELVGFLVELSLSGRRCGNDIEALAAAVKTYGVNPRTLEKKLLADLNAEAREKERLAAKRKQAANNGGKTKKAA